MQVTGQFKTETELLLKKLEFMTELDCICSAIDDANHDPKFPVEGKDIIFVNKKGNRKVRVSLTLGQDLFYLDLLLTNLNIDKNQLNQTGRDFFYHFLRMRDWTREHKVQEQWLESSAQKRNESFENFLNRFEAFHKPILCGPLKQVLKGEAWENVLFDHHDY